MRSPLHNTYSQIVGNLTNRKGATVTRQCESCGVVFERPARIAARVGRGRFCSRACKSRDHMRRRHAERPQVGAANPYWKGGVSGQHYRYTSRFRAKSPEKVAAQGLVARAVRSGQLRRPDTCSACGVSCQPHGHHDDYTQPLVVRWLCRACHIAHHADLWRAA